MYKNYMKKTAVIYMVIAINLLVQLGLQLASYLFSSQEHTINSYSLYGTDYMTGFLVLSSLMAIGLAFSQGIVLLAAVFNFDQFFGKHNRRNIIDIMKFTLVHSLMSSLVINLLILGLQELSNVNIQIIMGFKWFEFSQMPQKILLLTIISMLFYGLGMWITSGFKKDGVLNGLARIAIVITYLVHHSIYFNAYYTWGENALTNMIIFLVVILLTYAHTYFNMVRHERRSS